ncbi:uncharacterized protein DFL_006409 [Arthrobotrys flagrans]|uniref:Autophagy-related protein 3 n=1 Tax=Arthrobotrys flagrans TaxID=97331 RepID=A0A437A130_ARTFL|nr:hypothetical protein DFL_006409 [Arthrobotrys flagrans]
MRSSKDKNEAIEWEWSIVDEADGVGGWCRWRCASSSPQILTHIRPLHHHYYPQAPTLKTLKPGQSDKEKTWPPQLDDNFAGSAGLNDRVVEGADGGVGDDEGWLSTGVTKSEEEGASSAKDVRTVDDKGRVEESDDTESIGDMDEEDDPEAIIRDGDNTKTPLRTYTLYITYSTYYSTPRLYLTGQHGSTSSPLTHAEMMQDIVGDYQDKTVTIEEFPFLEGNLKMPSVHPCKHASVMRLLLDRANAAAKAKKRREAEAEKGAESGGESKEEREWEEIDYSKTLAEAKEEESDQQGKAEGKAGNPDDEAIRADQYLVVFLKFMASVTPGIEHDYTMGL